MYKEIKYLDKTIELINNNHKKATKKKGGKNKWKLNYYLTHKNQRK